ncbi:MAG: hypothetical protein H7Z20_11285 [Bdellovibrio sp.]|nr:hypothetical protein [Methylotenera sp.]
MGLDTVEFVLLAEKEFDLQLPDDEVSLVATIGDYADLVHQKLIVKHGIKPCPSQNEVYSRIKNLLIQQFAIPEALISRNASFVNDLQMD